MRIVFLGTNGFAPSDEAHTVCCMLPEVGIVLDAGTGLFRAPHYQQTDTLDIYLSHSHRDHTVGLMYLFGGFMQKVVSQAKIDGQADDFRAVMSIAEQMPRKVTVHAVESVLDWVKNELGEWSMNWQPLSQNHDLPENGKLTYFPLDHTIECYGFRLDWADRSLAFVMDTFADKNADYVQHITGVDVLVHDCYLPDSWAEFARITGHSHISAVAQVAAQAGVGQLVLTHHNTAGLELEMDTAQAIFPRLTRAYDGLEITF